MMIVLARGMSMPFSIIVVATSTSPLKATKSSITCSISFSFICPCATVTRAAGTRRLTSAATVSIVSTRLWMKKTCPPRPSSSSMADLMTDSENCTTCVWMARRSRGGVSMTDMSRRPIRDMLSVRGMGVAGALLLVDDDEAEVAEADVFREQAVRADDDVDVARLDALDYLLLLLRRAEARDQLDGDGEGREARAEGLVVLIREHGGGREHRHLLRVHDGLEGGAHGDLG